MTESTGDIIMKAAGAGGAVFVLVAWVRYMMQELAAARALIAAKDSKLEQQIPVLERISNLLERIEQHISERGPRVENSNPELRVTSGR